MPPPSNNTPKPAHQLLSAAQARTLLTVADPDYGKDFPEEEWERIAERLSALTRLLWRIRCRQLAEERESVPQNAPDNG